MKKQDGMNKRLKSHSQRPRSFPTLKVSKELKAKILVLRKERNLGTRRIQNELIRLDSTNLSSGFFKP